MHRDPRLYLDDILEAITQIREYTTTLDYDSFSQDRKTQDAVARNLEIIGEAAGRLPESIKMNATGIEWRKIVSLISSRKIPESKPITGDAIFIHEFGIHCAALLKDPLSYQPYLPQNTGRKETRFVFGKHSGSRYLRKIA